MNAASDTTLVERSLRGDRDAFGAIVDRYKQVVCATAMGVLGDAVLSEDVGQDAFVEAWRNLHQLRRPEKLRSWVCRIARSRSIDAARRRQRHKAQASGDRADGRPDPFEELAKKETAALVWAVIERMPESSRAALVLFYRQGRSVREVAEQLGVSEATVKQRLSRGRRHVRAELEKLIGQSLEASRPDERFTIAVLGLLPAGGSPPIGAQLGANIGGWISSAIVVGVGVVGFVVGLLFFDEIVGADGEPDGLRSEPGSETAQTGTPFDTADQLTASGVDQREGGSPSVQAEARGRGSEPSGVSPTHGDRVAFWGVVTAEPAGAACSHSRVRLSEGASYPVGEVTTLAAATDASGRFDLGDIAAGTYQLQVSCRESGRTIGYREVLKTFAIVLPRDTGGRFPVDLPEGFELVVNESAGERPPQIAELFDANGRPVVREVPRGWRPNLDAADANGDGVVSDREWRIHDEITSYVLTLDQTNSGESDEDSDDQ